MLSPRDKRILKFMENINIGLTINQAAMMFFPKKFAYYYARTRMRTLWERGLIKKYKNNYTDELIYYLDAKPTFHANAVLNVYANFIYHDYKVKQFDIEKQWLNGKYRSDAFIVAENDKEIRIVIIEVDATSVTNIKKYEELFESRELQNKYSDFPMVLILSDVERKYKSDNFEISTLDIKCTDFQKVLI